MIGHYFSTRSIYYTVAEAYTKRYCSVAVNTYTKRYCYVWFEKRYNDIRTVFFQKATFISERSFLRPSNHTTHTSNRICIGGEGTPNTGERFCYFTIGYQIQLYSIETDLPITYFSDRNCATTSAILTQRQCILCIQDNSEKQCYVSIKRQLTQYTLYTSSTIKAYNEKFCFYTTGSYSNKICNFCYLAFCEKTIMVGIKENALMHTPLVKTQLNNFYSERFCIGSGSWVYNDRYAFFLTSPYNEKLIMLKYRTHSDRICQYYIGQIWNVHCFIVTPSDLVATHRTCVTKSFAYTSERTVFIEQRELYITKTPLTSTPKVSIRNKNDNFSSVKVINERETENYGMEGFIQKNKDIYKIKTINQTNKNDIQMTMVDNKGASINTIGLNIKKKLIYSTTIQININKT